MNDERVAANASNAYTSSHPSTSALHANILIVDDIPENLHLLSAILAKQGHRVRAVMQGSHALKDIKVVRPDLILLDVRMPEMDGYEVCRHLKNDPKIADVPVIFISALDDVVDKIKAFSAGGVDYITKPFQIQEVLARVTTHLELRALQVQLQDQNETLQQEIKDRLAAEKALEERDRRIRSQNAVLIRLARNKALYAGDLTQAVREMTEAAAETLGVERVSIWLYNPKRTKLRCIDLFENRVSFHAAGTELLIADNPAYFAALEQDWIIDTSDAHQDPRTAAFGPTYLTPLGIQAMLATPIRLGGITMGVTCLERVGCSHDWSAEEQNFAASLSDLVSLAIEAHGRKRTERALKSAEEKYRGIFENAIEGIYQITAEGRYISANPALARIYGYHSPKELAASLTDVANQLYVDPNRRAEFVHQMNEHGTVTGFESQVYRSDGSVIWISETARAVYDAAGTLLYYEGILEDISRRKETEEALRLEQAKSERLLLNILPEAIAEQLKQNQSISDQTSGETTGTDNHIAQRFESVTILFADIVNFTELSAQVSPTQLVELLNKIFSRFDRLVEDHGLEKIKTIGDAYMVVGGLPTPRPDHGAAIANLALSMQHEITAFKTHHGDPFQLRIGINTGPVVAGVIGLKKFGYDLWGDSVNIASRMESQGTPGKIQVTESTYAILQGMYCFEPHGRIDVKGRGQMATYWLLDRV